MFSQLKSRSPKGAWGRISSETRGVVLAVLAGFWASAFLIPYKRASANGEPQVVAFGLLLSAAVLSAGLGASGFVPRDPTRGGRRAGPVEWSTAAAMGALAVGGNVCSATALTHLGPATVSVVMRMEVLLVGAFGWWWLGEQPKLGFWIGAPLALVGLFVLNDSHANWRIDSSVGFGLLAAMCFSAMQLLARRVAQSVNLGRLNTLRLWLSAAFFLVVPDVWLAAVSSDASFWGWVILAAGCGPVLSRLLLMYSVRFVSAAQTSLVMLCSPVFALVLGALFLGDLPTRKETLGGLMMLAGIGASLVRRRPDSRAV